MVETYLRFAMTHGAHYRTMFPPKVADPSSPWSAVASAAFQRLAVAVAAVRSDLDPGAVMKVSTALWALCHGVVTSRLDGLLVGAGPFATDTELVTHTTAAAQAIVSQTIREP